MRAQPNGNWVGEAKFKLTFKHGGAIEFGQALLRVAQYGKCLTLLFLTHELQFLAKNIFQLVFNSVVLNSQNVIFHLRFSGSTTYLLLM